MELFRQENVPLETEEARLGQQYQKLSGSLTVPFRGEERTLAQMGRYLEEPDRPLRQEAWELTANRRLREAERFEDSFEQLLKLREQIAANAGFPNYLEYAFQARGRFDYTPGDCRKFPRRGGKGGHARRPRVAGRTPPPAGPAGAAAVGPGAWTR